MKTARDTRDSGSSQTFRIFVSSTFGDLRAERDALQEHVFPRLAELCRKSGARFEAIDLRWGISKEAGLDQRAIPICLDEIGRCQAVTPKPNFIVLLGDRYGWRPLPYTIPAKEFTAIEAEVIDPKEKDLLLEWYRLDENAVPPAWYLKPRSIDKKDGEEDKVAADREFDEWAKTEARLHTILARAVVAAGFDEKARTRYEASATEQEIMLGAFDQTKAKDAAEHVFCFFRDLKTKDGTPLSKFAATNPMDVAVKDFPFLDAKPSPEESPSPQQFVFDPEAHDQITMLKAKLKNLLEDHVHDYQATWSPALAKISHDHIGIGSLPATLADCEKLLDDPKARGTLCLDVWRRLATLIGDEIEAFENTPQLEVEIKAHEKFGEDRRKCFVGRKEPLATIAHYLAGNDQNLLAIVGEPGSGKSALMAEAIKRAQEAYPEALIAYRFIGATPASSDGRGLLDSLCRQITAEFRGDESTIPLEYDELAVEFGKRLELASETRPLIVVLDALDQLADQDPARRLSWLPATLPANVRFVASVLPDECRKALLAKHPTPDVVEVKSMPEAEADELLLAWLKDAGRTLRPAQQREVLDKFALSRGLPLYLRLAFEEARQWHSYSPRAETFLHEGVQGIIRQNLFLRLSDDANHGKVLVNRAMGNIAASRHGLSEDEMLDILSEDRAVRGDFAARSFQEAPERLPVVVWSRLYFDVKAYLSERSHENAALLVFYHNQLLEAASTEYCPAERHAGLASHFRRQAEGDPGDQPKWGGSARGLSELPYHLAEAGSTADLYDLLTDFKFLEQKASRVAVVDHPGDEGSTQRSFGGAYELEKDYAMAIAKLGGGEGGLKPLIVTGTNFGQGLVIRCPRCHLESPLQTEWQGTDIACPNPECQGTLRVNKFVVG